ncbi:MAG: hypothetical protein N2C14_30320, partial [Planctomycetales bacterium]
QPGKKGGQGKQPGQGNQPGKKGGQGKQPGQGNQPASQPGQAQQPSQGGSQRPSQGGLRSQRPAQSQPKQEGNFFDSGAPGPGGNPVLTGDNFRDWSDQLRDVEEMLEDPRLQADAARIRDQAREMRQEFKRHSKPPEWSLVEKLVLKPLLELRTQLDQELATKEMKDSRAPIDRDPVPPKFDDLVRRYYERLGSGK